MNKFFKYTDLIGEWNKSLRDVTICYSHVDEINEKLKICKTAKENALKKSDKKSVEKFEKLIKKLKYSLQTETKLLEKSLNIKEACYKKMKNTIWKNIG